MLKNFDELMNKVKSEEKIRRVVVVCAHDEHALEAVVKASDDGLVYPILVGIESKIVEILDKLGFDKTKCEIYNVLDDVESAKFAVKLIRHGKGDFLMKAKIQTADFLRAVVNKETGLRTGKVMSMVAMFDIPNYHKLLCVSDGGMCMYPDLVQKKQIIENNVQMLLNMGYKKPNVAVLTAVEKVNPKMQETVDAAELKKMYLNGEIKNCYVEGPISYDIAMDKESAQIKGVNSPVTENADILIVPNITTGNILGKTYIFTAKAKMAGLVLGAKCPIVLTSRGAAMQEKYLSLSIAALSVN